MSERSDSPETTSSQETVKESTKGKGKAQLQIDEASRSRLSASTTPLESPSCSPRLPKRPRADEESGSDTEKESKKMSSSRTSKHHDSSSRRHSSSKSSRTKVKSDDWTEVTDPEERRRIQNRIAQRKFREKAKEHKEKAERDSRNQEYASNNYQIPQTGEIADAEDLSGLPWGSFSMSHVVARGHESESRRGSARDENVDSRVYDYEQSSDNQQAASYGSRDSGDWPSFDDPSYFYGDFGSLSRHGSQSR